LGTVIAGIVVIATFLLTSGVMFSAFLSTSGVQTQSLKEMVKEGKQRSGSSLNITSATFDDAGRKDLTVQVNNTGSQSVSHLSQMDVIAQYTDSANNLLATRLVFQTGAPGDNQWTVPVTGVQPDSFNPKIWDSDEILTIDMRVEPAVKAGASALIVVATPWGVADQTTVTAP
jgi:flagellar protein FlaF